MSNQRYVSEALRRRKKRIQKLKIYFLIFTLLSVIGAILYLFRIPQIQVSEIQVSGNTFIPTEEIKNVASTYLDSEIFWVIPKRNIFVLSSYQLEGLIKNNPAVIEAKVKKYFFKKIKIDIIEQEKEAIYCTSTDRTLCFYLNSEGYIYSKIDEYVVPEQEIILYLEGQQKDVKEFILNNDLYVNVMTFIKSSARYGITISHVLLTQDNLLEFNVLNGSILKTSIYDDFEKDFNNLVALFDQNVITKEQLVDIEYIDLRFGNKVFYKNKTN